VKLKHLSVWNQKRQKCAEQYQTLFSSATQGVKLPYTPKWAKSVYHLYVVRTEHRDQLRNRLAEVNIGSGIHYPIPLHLQKAYRRLGYKKGQFPVSERASDEILSLPMYPGLKRDQQELVAEQITKFAVAAGRKGERAITATGTFGV
jgi:dTDP-4-amino-4,6-dideoxygalactose transaminase